MVFAARVLSCVVYKEANLAARPVIANPALAGMAFGWGQALYGAFPGLQTVLAVSPAFAPGQSTVSGHLTLSIKNRQVVYPTYRLLRQLPIKEIIRVRVFGRGG